MAKSVIKYDRPMPEIAGRCPWQEPTSHLIKDTSVASGWRAEKGRRASKLLLIPTLREKVGVWRKNGYEGASEITKILFQYWFEEEHQVAGFSVPFRYHFCQREAIETLAWLVEIDGRHDIKVLLKEYAEITQADLHSKSVEFSTDMDGIRRVHRLTEDGKERVQELPPADMRRFAFKMATGSGKTWAMAMAIVWAFFHKRKVADSPLSTNFLIVAPNVIVYQRLEKDFSDGKIFRELPLVPHEWRGEFNLNVIVRGQSKHPTQAGNLFLNNIHQLYRSRTEQKELENPVQKTLGRPVKDEGGDVEMLERIRTLKDIIVINDEAHHVHDDDLEWNKSLLSIHERLPNGISSWLDFSATPKDQSGMYFPWTIIDYPLAQAVEDRIVKVPLLVDEIHNKNAPAEPDGVSKKNVIEKYDFWIRAAVDRWKEHQKIYKKLDLQPILFVMAEKSDYADKIGAYLCTKGFGFKQSEVLVIHTDTAGVITKGDLDKARKAARDIDKKDSPYKAIVSVMMLREGWDVRNVSVALGLRSFSAKAEILPEQVVGRGLRLMSGVGAEKTQTLEVLGTPKLLEFLRNELEAEGVGVVSSSEGPPPPIVIEPVQEKIEFDIALPITKRMLKMEIIDLSKLDIMSLGAIYEQVELNKELANTLKIEYSFSETIVGEPKMKNIYTVEEILTAITNRVTTILKQTGRFAEFYPVVENYVVHRCFGRTIYLEGKNERAHLSKVDMRNGIADYLARVIGELSVQCQTLEFENAKHHLSDTKPFSWRRNLPALKGEKTVFNYVATYNNFERSFAEFADNALDVVRFAALGTTEQGDSSTLFRVDYLKENGSIGLYYPDWVVIQKVGRGEVNWIIETKGRVWENTEQKDKAMKHWCASISEKTGQKWRYMRVNQSDFEKIKPTVLRDLTQEYKLDV